MDDRRTVLRSRFRRRLTRRFLVRWHMTLILVGVVASGLAVNRTLVLLGIRWLPLRWVLAVAISYLAFFALVRLWVAYVGRVRQGRAARRRSSGDLGVDLPLDLPAAAPRGGSALPPFRAGGGRFGGGGASGHLDADASAPSRGTLDGLDLGFGVDDEGGFVILVVLGALLVLLFGAGAWVIYQAPAILTDAAFEVALASGLVRPSRRLERAGWLGSVFRATVIPFGLVLAGSGGAGWLVSRLCPAAAKLSDVLERCL